MSFIRVERLSFSYGKKNILEDINLKIDKGEILCLLGPNGCGKTTLLDCILGLKRFKDGSIIIKGKNIRDLKPQHIGKSIAYVPQTNNRTFPYKVIDIVLMGRAPYTSIFSSPSKEDLKIAEEALGIVGMEKYRDRIYTNLSGGEGQLVMIARALAQKTPIIVMDEPTAHLDFKHELMILETVTDLVKQKALSILMATHFPNHGFYFENNNIPTSVAMMNKRKIDKIGKPSEVLNEENMRAIFNINSKILSYYDFQDNKSNYIVPLNTNRKIDMEAV